MHPLVRQVNPSDDQLPAVTARGADLVIAVPDSGAPAQTSQCHSLPSTTEVVSASTSASKSSPVGLTAITAARQIAAASPVASYAGAAGCMTRVGLAGGR